MSLKSVIKSHLFLVFLVFFFLSLFNLTKPSAVSAEILCDGEYLTKNNICDVSLCGYGCCPCGYADYHGEHAICSQIDSSEPPGWQYTCDKSPYEGTHSRCCPDQGHAPCLPINPEDIYYDCAIQQPTVYSYGYCYVYEAKTETVTCNSISYSVPSTPTPTPTPTPTVCCSTSGPFPDSNFSPIDEFFISHEDSCTFCENTLSTSEYYTYTWNSNTYYSCFNFSNWGNANWYDVDNDCYWDDESGGGGGPGRLLQGYPKEGMDKYKLYGKSGSLED